MKRESKERSIMPKNEQKKKAHRSGKYKDQHGRKKAGKAKEKDDEEGNGLTLEQSLRVLEREKFIRKKSTNLLT